jgi:hypothetical protein
MMTTKAEAELLGALPQELDWLPVADLRVDHSYQRPLDMKRVRKMAAEFDLDAYGSLIVSRRADGGLWTIDGQHRVALMHEIGWGDQTAPCLVHTGLTIQQEAKIFAMANDGSRPNALAKFRAKLVEGDPTIADINRTVRACGLQVTPGIGAGHVQAAAALQTVYSKAGGLVLTHVLRHILAAWGNASTNFQSDILLALALFEVRYKATGFDVKRLRECMSTTTPNQLMATARSRKESGAGSIWTEIPSQLVERYNKRLPKGGPRRLPDWERRTNVREVWRP